MDRKALFIVMSVLFASGVAIAGTLDLAWTPADSPGLAGYRLHIGNAPGRYDKVLEVPENHASLEGLQDGRPHYFRVEAMARDEQGGLWTLSLSEEIASLPRPEVTVVGPLLPAGDGGYVLDVQGRNLAPRAVVRLAVPTLRVVSVESVADGSLRLRVLHEPRIGDVGLPEVEPSSVLVINPGRKAREFLAHHPLAADVDGDGVVAAPDLEALRSRQGWCEGQSGFLPASDINGDGATDGADLALLASALGEAGRSMR